MTVLHNSLSATVLIAVIVLVRAAALHRLPKNTFCVLWIAAALRLLLPFSIESDLSFFTFFSSLFKKDSSGLTLFATVIPLEEVPAEIGDAASRPFPTLTVLWLAGVCILTVFFLVSYIRAMAQFRRSTPVRSLSIHALPKTLFPVQIRQSGQITGPLTYGLFRPVILLPEATGWDDMESLSFILAHECAHIRRCDCLTKLLFAAALCVHWFNPAAWVLCWLANRDMELACDEKAILSLGEASRFAYARTLLSQAEHASSCFPLFSHFGAHVLEERIVSALKRRRRSVWRTMAACLLVAVTLTVFGTGAAAEKTAAEPGALAVETAELANAFPKDVWFGVGFCSDGPEEVYESLKLTTLDGEPVALTSNQHVDFLVNDRVVEQGVVYGLLFEYGTDGCVKRVMENGRQVLLRGEFHLLSSEPTSFVIGEQRFNTCYTLLSDTMEILADRPES